MASLRNAVPASLRMPLESSNFVLGLAQNQRVQSGRMTMTESPIKDVAVKSRFAPLPQEPDDARITGVTRSLTRRLLGLNMPKLVAKTAA